MAMRVTIKHDGEGELHEDLLNLQRLMADGFDYAEIEVDDEGTPVPDSNLNYTLVAQGPYSLEIEQMMVKTGEEYGFIHVSTEIIDDSAPTDG